MQNNQKEKQKEKQELQIQKDLYYKRLAEMIPCPNRDFEGICLVAMKPCRGVCYEGSESIC